MNISIRDLHYAYPSGAVALDGVTMEIRGGERLAIVGQNGSGKTTLAKHLNGLLRPTRGAVMIGDWDTRERTVAKLSRRVGLTFQNPDDQIFKDRVADEVAFSLRLQGLTEREIEKRTAQALDRTRLADFREAHPYELLPSQRRWVALASVLAMDTPILVLDEPTTGEDAWGLERLGRLVRELASEGKTIVAITHDMDWCAEHFDRVIVMNRGNVSADGDAHRIFAQLDLLSATSLEPPQITRLGIELRLPHAAVTVEEFLAGLRAGATR